MTRIIWYVILITIAGIFTISDHYANALYGESPTPTVPIGTYEKSGFTLTHNPMICIYDPSPVTSFPNLSLDLSRMTSSAISNWSSLLHDSSHPKNWDIYFDEVSYDKVATFDSSKCDITISYLPSPSSSPDQNEPVGETVYDFTNHKAKITIYYLAMTTQIHTKTVLNAYVYYWYTVTGYDPNQMAPEGQISQALRHELGHAFGLGHYVISEQDENTIVKFGRDIPSIMMPLLIQQTRNYYDSVTQSDIQELKSLYGTNGFSSSIQLQSTSSVSQTASPTQSPQSNPTILIPATVKSNAKDWSNGVIDDNGFVKVLQWFAFENAIKLPSTSQGSDWQTVIPSWVKKDTKLWINGDVTDSDFFTTLQYLIDNKIITLNPYD